MTDLRSMSRFRDAKVAEEFQRMAEMGYLDEEFTMYGTCWLAGGERQYLVSSAEHDIVVFKRDAARKGICASPIRTATEICHVPAGMKEAIGNQVKIRLARQMAADYPLAFLRVFDELAQTGFTDTARAPLEAYVRSVKNTFSAIAVTMAEELVVMAFEKKTLMRKSYDELMSILALEKVKMQDDIIVKRRYSKTFNTLVAESAPGRLRMTTNARLEWVEERRSDLIAKGALVAPAYTRTYWYDMAADVPKLKQMHDANCAADVDERYLATVRAVYDAARIVNPDALAAVEAAFADDEHAACRKMLAYYRALWGDSA